MKDIKNIRQPIVEGLFYPDDNYNLNNEILRLLAENPTEVGTGNKIILPHAGWECIGDYLALGFNSLPKKDFNKVVIISNVHREFINNIILPESQYFQLIDKKIKVDLDCIKQIKECGKKVIFSDSHHMEEHGIEVVLPFINHLYPNAKIVPILLGKTVVSLVRILTNIIKTIEDEKTLIVITSNFSGYERKDISKELGELGLDLIKSGKMGDLIELTRTNKLKVCGSGAIGNANPFQCVACLPNEYASINHLNCYASPLNCEKRTF